MPLPKPKVPEVKPTTQIPVNQMPNLGTITASARKQISQMIMQVLKSGNWDNGKKLSLGDKRRLERLYRFTNDPNAQAGAISKVVSSIGAVGASLATNIGEIITGTVLPKEQTKREQARLNAEVQKAAIESNRAIQEQAISAGVWNAGLSGNPNNNSGQQRGSNGNSGGTESTGSFLGG